MRRILCVVSLLALIGCGRISPNSPELLAGTFDLELVNVDAGRGNVYVLVKLGDHSDPSGFIQLNSDATYTLTATYNGLAGTTWQTNGMYRVDNSGLVKFTIPVGRTFSGSLTEERRQISVTENLNHATVRLVFNRAP